MLQDKAFYFKISLIHLIRCLFLPLLNNTITVSVHWFLRAYFKNIWSVFSNPSILLEKFDSIVLRITCLLRSKLISHQFLDMIVVAVDHNPLVLQCPKALIQSHCHLYLVYVKQFQTLLGHVFLEIFHPNRNIALSFLYEVLS